jgi:hypothetical protein
MMKKFITYSTIATMSSFIVALVTFGVLLHFKIPRHPRIKCIYEVPRSLLAGERAIPDRSDS